MNYSGFKYSIYKKLPYRLQNYLVTKTGDIRWGYENSEKFRELVKHLIKIQYNDKQFIYNHQKNKLIAVLHAAKATKFYSPILPSAELIDKNPFSVLDSVPVLNKDVVRSDFQRFINPSFVEKVIQHGTSGTTGTPLQIIWTEESIDMERALIWRQRMQTGLEFGKVWRGMLGAHQIVPIEQKKPPFWRVNKHAKQIYFSTYHLSPETAQAYYKALKRYDIRAFEGFPSAFFALAYSFCQNGLEYPLENNIYYGAEPLQDFQRELIEEVFQCYIWDYYGLTERVASASEFECKNGLHENWENSFLEIVDSSGNQVPEGEYGELVGTSLSNLGFPLLRYRTGDMTHFLSSECACGRSSRRIARIDTKREDLLLMPDGSFLSASNLTYPFKEASNILESQLYQNSPELLHVRIVPSSDYSIADGDKLIYDLRKLVPNTVKIKLVEVIEIPRTKSGKYRFSISTLTGKEQL